MSGKVQSDRSQRGVARPCFWCGLPGLVRGSTTALVADLLESDPEMGWTRLQIADRLCKPRSTVHRALYRLRAAEVVDRSLGGREGVWRWVGLPVRG